MSFIHLQVKSSYSLLSSTLTLEKIVELAKKNNSSHVALTDVDAMYGALEFYDICKKHHITPIFGLEFSHVYQGNTYRLIGLAKNKRGYQNLMKISSHNQLSKDYIDFNELSKYKEGLIFITPQKHSYVTECYLNHHPEYLKDYMNQLKTMSPNVFVGITNHHTTMERTLNRHIMTDFKENEIVLLNDVLYEAPSDSEYYEVLINLRDGKKINDRDAYVSANQENYFRSNE